MCVCGSVSRSVAQFMAFFFLMLVAFLVSAKSSRLLARNAPSPRVPYSISLAGEVKQTARSRLAIYIAAPYEVPAASGSY